MEKKKLLLVAVSVGVFLVIVFSIAILFFFKPGPGAGSTVTSISSVNPDLSAPSITANTSPLELAGDTYRDLMNEAASPRHEQFISINGDLSMTLDTKGDTVINVPKPNAVAVPDVRPAAVRPAPAQVAPARPAPAVSSPAAPKKAYRDYWVQAGSFSTRERADGVKATLGNKGITAVVTNQEINGNTYYRVRIGPYTSQNEADYWLAMVKSIDGFQDSQIWESQSYR
ncbi:MAG: SPOR domain-containing protein [Treponema sp.]|nr:SPOR domain-containing protein [Treponema sp.]